MTKKYLTPNEIKEIIESSFSPYRCVAGLWDSFERARFKVYDTDNKSIIFKCDEIEVHGVDKKELKDIISGYCYNLARLGFHLDKDHDSHE